MSDIAGEQPKMKTQNATKEAQQSKAPQPLLSIKRFAELVSISEREAYRKVRDREIEYVQVGAKRIGIPQAAYERFIESRTRPALQ